MEEVKTFLEGRKAELSEVRSIVSLFKDTTDYMSNVLVDTVVGQLLPESLSEHTTASKAIASVVSDLVQTVPERIQGKTYQEDTMYSQFMAMTQQMLFSDNSAANIQSLMKESAKNLATEALNSKQLSSTLKEGMTSFLSDFTAAIAENPKPDKLDTSGIASKLLSQITEAKNKTVALQARTLSGLDFSDFRIQDVLRVLETAKNDMPTGKLLPAFKSDASDILSQVDELKSKLETLYRIKDNLIAYKDNFRNTIKPGDVFAQNFSQLYSLFSSMESELGFVPNKDISKAIATFSSIGSSLDGVAGLVSLLGTRKYEKALDDEDDPVNKQMEAFKLEVATIPDVIEEVATLDYSAKALVRTAERYIAGELKQDPTEVLGSIQTKMDSAFDGIDTAMDTFQTVLNVFDPPATTDAIAFMNSIGTVAPAALDAVLQGEINNFKKTMTSPALLTKAGHAIASMKTFIADNAEKLTIQDKNMFGIVSSYLAGEHKRSMMSMWIGNTSAQRSRALTSLDITVNKFIRPVELLVNTLENKFKV